MRPVLFILPVSAKAFVPGLVSVPNPRYHSEPLLIIIGTFAYVSTLFRTVGLSKSPCSTVLGGLTLGNPRRPSMDEVSALPSPHTNAPAPLVICIWNEKSVPSILSPRSPVSSACAIAFFRRSTARGYSART